MTREFSAGREKAFLRRPYMISTRKVKGFRLKMFLTAPKSFH